MHIKQFDRDFKKARELSGNIRNPLSLKILMNFQLRFCLNVFMDIFNDISYYEKVLRQTPPLNETK